MQTQPLLLPRTRRNPKGEFWNFPRSVTASVEQQCGQTSTEQGLWRARGVGAIVCFVGDTLEAHEGKPGKSVVESVSVTFCKGQGSANEAELEGSCAKTPEGSVCFVFETLRKRKKRERQQFLPGVSILRIVCPSGRVCPVKVLSGAKHPQHVKTQPCVQS